MKLILSPQRSDVPFTYSAHGDILSINGTEIDLSGDWVKLEADEGEDFPDGLIAGERDSITGEITLTVRAPHGPNAPQSDLFPEPVTLGNGETLELPRNA